MNIKSRPKKFKLNPTNALLFAFTKHYSTLMVAFYELQSSWMSRIYKRYKNIETANIICSFARNTHLEIIRQKEYNLNHDVSLSNFWVNFYNISKPVVKITYLANETAIPKETVRRKVKNLSDSEFIVYGRYAGSRFQTKFGEHRILNDDEIIARIKKPEDILQLY